MSLIADQQELISVKGLEYVGVETVLERIFLFDAGQFTLLNSVNSQIKNQSLQINTK
jgi:hypothetical protein